MTFAGAVLCGGESRRMGRDKALVEIDGRPMALRAADALRAAGAYEVIGVGGDLAGLARHGLDAIADERPNAGPLAALVTVMHALPDAEVVVVLSCDLLAPDPAAIRRVVQALDAAPRAHVAVPTVDGHHQWHHGAWRRGALPAAEANLAAGRRGFRDAVEDPALVLAVGEIPAAATADADAPQDLMKADWDDVRGSLARDRRR